MTERAKRPRTFMPRKLLVAAAGVATINYVAMACVENETSGNLPAPRCTMEEAGCTQPDTGPPPTSGNLPAPPPPVDAGSDADAQSDAGDASDDGAVTDAGDSG